MNILSVTQITNAGWRDLECLLLSVASEDNAFIQLREWDQSMRYSHYLDLSLLGSLERGVDLECVTCNQNRA